MKKKGCRTERELVHLFWDNGWSASRVAGSGSTSMPAPDLLAGNKSRFMAIECKSLKSKTQYLKKEQMNELKVFAEPSLTETLSLTLLITASLGIKLVLNSI